MSEGSPAKDLLFTPIRLGPLEVKNRLFRSSIAGRFDNYDGSGTPVRVNWDVRFARGGVGAIISSNAPVSIHGRLVPGYALSDADDKIPFWREVGRRVHEHDCKYILQLAHAGRERLVRGIEFDSGLSSTSRVEPLNGFQCSAMTTAQIHEVIDQFAQAARRAREAGLDGVELAGANGVLFTQFLSSGINDRKDEWGGTLENRARFALEVVRAVRRLVGDDFCLGFKISLREHLNEILPWLPAGNTIDESLQVCRWLADEGVVNIGCECASIDSSAAMPDDAKIAFPAHRTCRDRGILNTENLANLESVVGRRFLYVGLPLRLVGGTGCPIRAVAVLDG